MLMAAQRPTVREIVTLGCNILSALHDIHSKGLIHFDVKPDNVLLSERGEGLLSDFGLAKQISDRIALQDRLYNKMIPPEATRGGDRFDRTFDIYQFGLGIFTVCAAVTTLSTNNTQLTGRARLLTAFVFVMTYDALISRIEKLFLLMRLPGFVP